MMARRAYSLPSRYRPRIKHDMERRLLATPALPRARQIARAQIRRLVGMSEGSSARPGNSATIREASRSGKVWIERQRLFVFWNRIRWSPAPGKDVTDHQV